jgi:hypothetical protein
MSLGKPSVKLIRRNLDRHQECLIGNLHGTRFLVFSDHETAPSDDSSYRWAVNQVAKY